MFVFYLWRHLWQTFRAVANFLYNSSLSRNARLLTLDQVFNQSLWKLIQMESTYLKTLKLQNFCKMLVKSVKPLMKSFSKVLQNSFKVIYCGIVKKLLQLTAILIFSPNLGNVKSCNSGILQFSVTFY